MRANGVFGGLWLFPFGLLVYRSGFLPRILGVWLMLNCFAYLATSFTGILSPQYEQRVSNLVITVLHGELAIMLWLIIMAAKETLPWRPPPDPAGIFNFPVGWTGQLTLVTSQASLQLIVAPQFLAVAASLQIGTVREPSTLVDFCARLVVDGFLFSISVIA
jgi:hypothetical protein